jgi:hypothetical protein
VIPAHFEERRAAEAKKSGYLADTRQKKALFGFFKIGFFKKGGPVMILWARIFVKGPGVG